jgi:hypothetical protein
VRNDVSSDRWNVPSGPGGMKLAESDMLTAAGGWRLVAGGGLVFRASCLDQARMVGRLGMLCRYVVCLETNLDRGGRS